jgi:hypothetical protein
MTPDTPFGANGESTARCTNVRRPCSWTGPKPASGHCPSCGAFVTSNEAALVHGGRQLQLHGPQTSLARERVAELRTSLIHDQGDEQATTRSILVDRLAEVALLAESTWAYLSAAGPLTKGGKQRAAVGLYLGALDRAAKLALALGLERRQKKLDIHEYLEQRYGARETVAPAAPADQGEATEGENDQNIVGDAGAADGPQEGGAR